MRPHDLVAAAKRAADRAGLGAMVHTVGEPHEIRCDATLLARALANLIDNASKHAGGPTGITVRFEEDRASIEVEDEGPGFSDGEPDRIFDPFYGRAKGSHDSLGLGLALVQRIARAHGGDAFAKNRPEIGAVVGLWLPAGAPAPPSSE
jgi:signal transduction histidine kinase